MAKKIRVMMVTPEALPFAKSGELADFSAGLPKHLAALGLDVSLIMPKYRTPEIESEPTETVLSELSVPLGGGRVKASVARADRGHFDIYFIDNPKYFLRERIYGPATGDYLDNDERFVFFSRAVLEFLLQSKLSVDILHCHNWPSALVPVFLKTHYQEEPQFGQVATVFTLHNVAFQGEFPPETLMLTELNWNYFNPGQLSLNGRFNFLKAGVVYADIVNTVSSAYKKEIMAQKHSPGLSEILRSRRGAFFSIRSGIDYEVWDPERDPYLAANYGLADMSGKSICKQALIREFGLRLSERAPVVAFVSRLSQHKGVDILIEAIDRIVARGVGLVVCGEGEEKFESALAAAAQHHQGSIAVRLEIRPALVHKVIAGADMLLIPSMHEPCGLNQFCAFRYGTVPVVRATGGLKETVRPYEPGSEQGNGFVFGDYSAEGLLGAVDEAIDCYRNAPQAWRKLREEGMRQNFSLGVTARGYVKLYEKALGLKRGG